MEGLLARWALTLQEYDFFIVYRKGCLNSNADTLSQRVSITGNHSAGTSYGLPNDKLLKEQQADPVLGQLRDALSQPPSATNVRYMSQVTCRFPQACRAGNSQMATRQVVNFRPSSADQ